MGVTASVGKLITDFEKGNGKAAFKHMNRKLVAKQLRDRVANPHKIDQGQGSLCGPAVLLFCVAGDKPEIYAKYIIDLYEKGKAKLGKLTVEPGDDCKSYKLPLGAMDEVDWIGLASLRDSENIFWDYQSINNELAGITMPGALKTWFEKLGYAKVEDATALVDDQTLHVLLQAHQKRKSGCHVCLFIGANFLLGKTNGKFCADHWVVLNSDIRIDNKPVDSLLAKGKAVDKDKELENKVVEFSVFTWGQSRYAVNTRHKQAKIKDFLDYFYGYVAAK